MDGEKKIGSTSIPALTEETTLHLLKYKVNDPWEDVRIEVEDFMKSDYYSSPSEMKSSHESNQTISLYENNFEYYFELASVHLRMKHILSRSQILGGVLMRTGAKIYADWGAGSGRDCIIASRLGVVAHHVDIGGAGHNFAEFRYKARGLDVKMWNITQEKPDEKFDVISNFDCLEHVPNPAETLADIVEHLKQSGLLLIAVDFFNISFDGNPEGEQKYHLPENSAYGGIWGSILEKVGMKKIYGMQSSFAETANASLVIFIKEKDVSDVKGAIKEETLKLLRKFRGYFDHHISLLENWK